jgi:hypothetical protein
MTASCSKACPRPIQTVDFNAAGPMSDQTYECETTSEGCPVERLRTALAEAHLILEQHEVMAQEYQQLKAVVAGRAQAAVDIATLTPRQHEILELVLIGTPSKNIAADLHISQRTVEKNSRKKSSCARADRSNGALTRTILHRKRRQTNSSPRRPPAFRRMMNPTVAS